MKNDNHMNYSSLQEKLALSSILMWLIWFTFCFSTIPRLLSNIPYLIIQTPEWLKSISFVIIEIGVLLAVWTRITRGLNSMAWGIYIDLPLIKSGPYKYIRHPSYLFYCIMFIFLPIMTGFLIGLVNTIGIYYYIKHIELEEELLKNHFGVEFDKYVQQVPWKLFPGVI